MGTYGQLQDPARWRGGEDDAIGRLIFDCEHQPWLPTAIEEAALTNAKANEARADAPKPAIPSFPLAGMG
jgi:hypothetical protein